MFKILIFLVLFKNSSSQILASGTLDHTIRLWNGTNNYQTRKFSGKTLASLEYDHHNKLILAGCKEKSILLWNIFNDTIKFINTTIPVDSIVSLNGSYFMIGSYNTVIIYRLSDEKSHIINDNFGIISVMRILKEDNLVLIGTNSSKIIVYDLMTHEKVFNKMNTSVIASLDCLNRSLIAAQCSYNTICLFNLMPENSLNIDKSIIYGWSNLIFSIKFVNETFIVFGYYDQNKIGMWNLRTNSLHTDSSVNIVLSIEVLDQLRIAYSEHDGDIKMAYLTDTLNRYFIKSNENRIICLKIIGGNRRVDLSIDDGVTTTGYFGYSSKESSTNIQKELVYFSSEDSFIDDMTTEKVSTKYHDETTKQIIHELTIDYQNVQNLQYVVNLLTGDFDMKSYYLNCSGNGLCKKSSVGSCLCECFENYVGRYCEIHILPCFSNPCRNNGSCENNLKDKKYKCECYSEYNKTSLYYGQNCENKIDICQNETCSKNGVCYDVNDEIKCKCFRGYSGDKCELVSSEMKAKKIVIKTTSIVAIVIILSFIASLVFLDLSNLMSKNSFRKEAKKKFFGQKLIYINK